MNSIPLVDLGAQYRAHKAELDAALAACLANTSFIGGGDHKAFAQEFSAFCGGGHTALCGNGTDALTLAILALLGRGDGTQEIVTVSHTFIATVEAIVEAGYIPTFADIDPATYCMSAAALEGAITPRTRAVIPVHLYGHMAPMDAIVEIAARHGLKVIEDAAQAHGAAWQGKGPGQWGDAACFSFYPGKNLGAWGDGGAVFSRDKGICERIETEANHGRSEKYLHKSLARNSRLDGLQAAILRAKLPHLAAWNAARARVADWYRDALSGLNGVALPQTDPRGRHVYHLFVVRVPERNRVLDGLNKRGIGAGVHYPIACHDQPACAGLRFDRNRLAETAAAAASVLSLPIYAEMTRDQVARVADALKAVL